ncbi:uncharacterized protein STEHIDRAFT_43622, partial [Stereum hirsutum FP-91666 SS1]
GNWIGDVPRVMKGLSMAEKMMISRVHHNRCIVRVAKSGQHRMKGNAICWSVPMPKIYKALPPTPEEMNEVLAFVYLGPEKPTEDDYKRTPLLVRKNKVKAALEWLKLNHDQYHDLTIAYDVLDRYSENTPIVVTDYRHSDNPIQPEATAVTGDESEEGTDTGPCTFQVHG